MFVWSDLVSSLRDVIHMKQPSQRDLGPLLASPLRGIWIDPGKSAVHWADQDCIRFDRLQRLSGRLNVCITRFWRRPWPSPKDHQSFHHAANSLCVLCRPHPIGPPSLVGEPAPRTAKGPPDASRKAGPDQRNTAGVNIPMMSEAVVPEMTGRCASMPFSVAAKSVTNPWLVAGIPAGGLVSPKSCILVATKPSPGSAPGVK